MKKFVYCTAAALMLSSLLSGCSKGPSEEEVRSALHNGTLTMEDALDKGYVDEDWIAQYKEENSVPASNKFSANTVEAFTAENVNGNDFSFSPSDTPVLFLFADPEDKDSIAQVNLAADAYEDILNAGGDAVIVWRTEQVSDELASLPVPAIFYTEDIKTLLGTSTEMIDGNSFSASWNMKGSFITAWYGNLDKSDLPQTVTDLLEAFAQPEQEEQQTDSASEGAVSMP